MEVKTNACEVLKEARWSSDLLEDYGRQYFQGYSIFRLLYDVHAD